MFEDWEALEESIPDGMDTQDILDEGYAILDGFARWLEEELNLDARVTQQDVFNAEMLVDYVAETARVSVMQMTEFDLRWFVYSHYIRNAKAETEIEERLIESLKRFVVYLKQEHGYFPEHWVEEVVNSPEIYTARWQALHQLDAGDEVEWLAGYRTWCAELEDTLDARGLTLPREMGDSLYWGETMGWREGTLRHRAHRMWLLHRAEMIGQGYGFEEMRDRLADAYIYWMDTPQSHLDGLTPKEMVLQERRERAEEEPEER